MVERFKGQRAIVAIMQEPFGTVNDLRGAANHFMDIVKNPELILRLNDIVVKHHLKLIKNCIDIGADIIAIAGDFAITDGPIVSPKHLEKFAIPPLAELVRFTHSLGVPLIKHTDGNIMPIMELILGTGMDALHPIDPIAGLDIGVVKEKYGDRICLIGNIDCGPLLMWGRKEEVRQAVKETIRKAGRGGGLIAASSHSIQSKVKPENYIEMVKAIREYGRYPLSL
jgi:uroporphyrinogen decarboxylase